MSNARIESDIRSCQRSLHKWGQANHVVFDSGKERCMIISIIDLSGGLAKVLGIDFDSKLVIKSVLEVEGWFLKLRRSIAALNF